jgi:hypothetical protein
MPDSDFGVRLRASFTSNLQGLGREMGVFSQGIKNFAQQMRDWARGVPTDDMLRKHIRLQQGLKEVQGEMAKAKTGYEEWTKKVSVPGLDAKALDEAKRNAKEAENILINLMRRQASMQDEQGEGEGGGVGGVGRTVAMRRMLRFGLGMFGLPMTIAGAARAVGEAQQQEQLIQGLATRLRPVNQGFEDFSGHLMRMREQIVDAGAAMAFSGRETIQLADALSRISGQVPDIRTVLEAARGMGVSPQMSGQLLAFARRFGAGPGGASEDSRLMNIVAQGISRTGMMPRAGEYIQAIVETMQQYATRLPSVQPDTIAALVQAINATGVPTLRGQGAMTFISGATAMMDDMSEAMIAMQTEILRERPDISRSFAARNFPGMTQDQLFSGPGRYFALMGLKQAGIADPDGLKLAGETINRMTSGFGKKMDPTRMTIESMLLRLSPTIVAALEKSGFMQKFLEGQITPERFREQILDAQRAMESPAMKIGRFGRTVWAGITGITERNVVGPLGDILGPESEVLEEAYKRGGKSFVKELGVFGLASLGRAALFPARYGLRGLGPTSESMGRELPGWMQRFWEGVGVEVPHPAHPSRKLGAADLMFPSAQAAGFAGPSGEVKVHLEITTAVPGLHVMARGAQIQNIQEAKTATNAPEKQPATSLNPSADNYPVEVKREKVTPF